MHVGVDLKCMQTNFGGCGLSCFEDFLTFKMGQIFFLDCPLGLSEQNRDNKCMHVEVDLKCMQPNFGGCGLSAFVVFCYFKMGQIFLLDCPLG